MLPKVPGPCRGRFPRYYYNSCTGKCESFIYGGCQGNSNNFKTKTDCYKTCPCKHYLQILTIIAYVCSNKDGGSLYLDFISRPFHFHADAVERNFFFAVLDGFSPFRSYSVPLRDWENDLSFAAESSTQTFKQNLKHEQKQFLNLLFTNTRYACDKLCTYFHTFMLFTASSPVRARAGYTL